MSGETIEQHHLGDLRLRDPQHFNLIYVRSWPHPVRERQWREGSDPAPPTSQKRGRILPLQQGRQPAH